MTVMLGKDRKIFMRFDRVGSASAFSGLGLRPGHIKAAGDVPEATAIEGGLGH